MVAQARVIWGPAFTAYNFGAEHPMGPVRLDLTARLCEALGVFSACEVTSPGIATDELLATVHDQAYIDAVKWASEHPDHADEARGLGTSDDPAFHGMHEASARIVQGTVDVCQAVLTGTAEHGVNFCGGMHHAMRDRASGFCIYNDIAVGIQSLLDAGLERVVYLDLDVHHGDGVEAIFVGDPRVLTLSIHENGRALFPGTGWPRDIGTGAGEGYAVNVALPPGTGDSAWLRAIEAGLLPVIRAFRPQFIVSQHGCDTHMEDPLAHLMITVDAQRRAMDSVHALAHEVCDGQWVGLGGGGYELINVVPRSWTHLTAVAAHQPIPVGTAVPKLARLRPGHVRHTRTGPDGRPWPRFGRHLGATVGLGYNPHSPSTAPSWPPAKPSLPTTGSTSGTTRSHWFRSASRASSANHEGKKTEAGAACPVDTRG